MPGIWQRRSNKLLLATATVALAGVMVLLAVMVDSDVTRVALPGIVTGVGTAALAFVTVLVGAQERQAQRELGEQVRSDEARRTQAAQQREADLNDAAALREARKVLTFATSRVAVDADYDQPSVEQIECLNAGAEPILDLVLVGATTGATPEPRITTASWQQGSGGAFTAVLLAGQRVVLSGGWTRGGELGVTLSEAERSNTVAEIAWTDASGRHWRRRGSVIPFRTETAWRWDQSAAD